MRVYFLSCKRAVLKLNGEYLGAIGAIEKYVDIADGEEVFAEVIPSGEFLPCNFFIGQSLFEKPPYFLNVYLFKDGVQIYITHFERLDRGLDILEQRRISGLNVTLFRLGGHTYLSCDGERDSLYALPDYFENCRLVEEKIGGFPVVCVDGKNCLCVISSSGNKLYLGEVKSYSMGDMLGLTIDYKGCAGYRDEREYSYDGQELKLIDKSVKKQHDVESAVKHFAFFEALLYGADCKEYLSEDIQGATEAIKEYLGNYKKVTAPHKAFYDRYGDICAAALAYPIKENLFEIKYFSVETVNGKIDNVNLLD